METEAKRRRLTPTPEKRRHLDALDHQILACLGEDPRVTNKAIAEKLSTSEMTLAARIRSMENDRVMRVMAQRDFRSMGCYVLALIDVNVLGRSVQAVATDLAKIENVGSVTLLLGDPSIICEVHTADLNTLEDLLLNAVGKIKGISSIVTNIVVNVIKYESEIGDLNI